MPNKTVEIKRKIISLIRNREPKEALKLFHKNFTEEKPAEIEFLKNIYVELNRFDLNKENFELLAQIGIWYPDNAEFQEIFENATNTYVGSLILQANNINFQRIEKEKSLEDSLKRADSLTREKMQIENSKQLAALNEKSKELFKLAVSLSPKNLTAYKGWLECCNVAGDTEEAEEVQGIIDSLNPSFSKKAAALKLSATENQVKEEEELPKVDLYSDFEKLFNEKKYEELINLIEKNESSSDFPVKALLLKAKSLVELRRFKDADKALFEAERQSVDYHSLQATKEGIAGIKLKLYTKAGGVFLEKAIKLGVPLGLQNFQKAKYCFMKAIEINPDDLNILDQAYSALKYLGEDEEAFKIKATIYSIQSNFKTTYDSTYNQTLCFIATYAFYDKPWIINDFRWFRREFLLTNRFGREVNSLYVCLSSRVTKALANNNFIRELFKLILYIPLLLIKLLQLLKR